jgi:glycosyltransferase involved in cell wall biosynthesis
MGPGPEIVEQHKNGLLADPLDAADIAAKINYLLDHPAAAAAMGAEARKRILEHFNAVVLGERNYRFYLEVRAVV